MLRARGGGFEEEECLPILVVPDRRDIPTPSEEHEGGPKMIFLDECFSTLIEFESKGLWEQVENMPLEQVIVLEKEGTRLKLKHDVEKRYDTDFESYVISDLREQSDANARAGRLNISLNGVAYSFRS